MSPTQGRSVRELGHLLQANDVHLLFRTLVWSWGLPVQPVQHEGDWLFGGGGTGFHPIVQTEIKFALDVADEQPDGIPDDNEWVSKGNWSHDEKLVRYSLTSWLLTSTTLLTGSGWVPAGSQSPPAPPSSMMVLTETHLGPLPLTRTPVISVAYLKQIFPTYNVAHDVGSGDSPDFHYFEVVARGGEVLFTIKSFIQKGNRNSQQAPAAVVPIDLLQVVSPRVRDKYGLRVGDRVADIVRARGPNLEFGASHHDVYLGGDQIVYNIGTATDRSPEGFTMADAIRQNWQIKSISWPTAAWD